MAEMKKKRSDRGPENIRQAINAVGQDDVTSPTKASQQQVSEAASLLTAQTLHDGSDSNSDGLTMSVKPSQELDCD